MVCLKENQADLLTGCKLGLLPADPGGIPTDNSLSVDFMLGLRAYRPDTRYAVVV